MRSERISTRCQSIAPQTSPQRFLLLSLILLAFVRLVWALDANALWWDESLTLQRAESSWSSLIRGTLVIQDGITVFPTTDQHPFFFFALTGLLIRMAGHGEFVLRFPSVMGATLLVPLVWVLGRALLQRRLVARSSPEWGALFAAVSPFFLWYGQEARPYALWAALALLSTYLLWRAFPGQQVPNQRLASRQSNKQEEVSSPSASSEPQLRRGNGDARLVALSWFFGYCLALFSFVSTHYYSFFLLPLHVIFIGAALFRHNRRLAITTAGGITLGIAVLGLVLGSRLIRTTGGINFDRIPVTVLLPDLLNAYSLGLSVDIGNVWWLDLLAGASAALGAGWALRSWSHLRQGGWTISGLVLIPVLVLLVINLVQPAYMNARHMSLIGGGYLLALGAGIGRIWQIRWWLAVTLAALLLAGTGYSTINYFTLEAHGKDDYRSLAAYVSRQMQPGDLFLLQPAASWRIFHYYLPLHRIDAYNDRHAAEISAGTLRATSYYGVPLLGRPWEELFAQLDAWKDEYRRIWYIRSGTNPYIDRESRVETWLNDHLYRMSEKRFFSHSALRASLFMDGAPVYNEPISPRGIPINVNFDDQIRLMGLEIERPLTPDSPLPLTLTWQTVAKTDLHYKSILRLVRRRHDGDVQEIGVTEREPYDGVISTAFWAPHQTIVEYTEIPVSISLPETLSGFELHIQLYPTETLEKAPIVDAQKLPASMHVGSDKLSLIVQIE